MSTDTRFANLSFAVTMTDDMYWAHQPDDVRAAKGDGTTIPAGTAYALAQKGRLIDVPIMIWGWEPTFTMVMREMGGYTWVPSMLQPNIPVPFISGPGLQNYNPNSPPAGSIPVSTNAADYAPADPPPPPPPAAPALDMVGVKQVSGVPFTNADGSTSLVDMYNAGPGTISSPTPNVSNGQTVPQRGVNFVAHYNHTFFGLSVVYTCPPGSTMSAS